MSQFHRGSRVALLAVALVACHRSQPSGTPHREADGSGSAQAAQVAPPPGSPELIPVPADIAAKVGLREVVTDLARPVLAVVAPGDPRKRLFIVEQRGKIRIFEHGKLADKPFFTIDGLSEGNEEGLLGLAFHPKFATNGKLYVDYTTLDKATHIVEYRVSASDPDTVDPSTARELIAIEHPFSNHNGGNLLFGPDGKLYSGMGDGGSAGDPYKNGQNRDAQLAKILRYDVETVPAPPPQMVDYGSRNPWRFWFDAKDGALYIGDVGQDLWENVYVVASDGVTHNFGWNVTEGAHCYNAQDCDATPFTPPVVTYPHEQGCSVTGGVTYHGKALPMLEGRYFYADYCTGLLRSFVWTHDPSTPTAPGWIRDHWDWKPAIDRDNVLEQISSFGVDADGEIYIVKLKPGAIYQLAPR